MKGPRYATDGSLRRRIHLFRHGDVSYVTEDGQRVPDPRLVPLTDWGLEQAKEMGEFLSHVPFDLAACSGLLRTVQTSQGILAGRGMEPIHVPEMEEVRGGGNRTDLPTDINEVAYAFSRAHEPEARYRDGELFTDFQARVHDGLGQLLARTDWHSLALVLHGGVNRVVLGWALGSGLESFSSFEQNTCCLNIIDIDTHPETGDVTRKLVRGVNITAYDTARQKDHFTTLEVGAERYKKILEGLE